MEDDVHTDIPAILEYVTRTSGAEAIHWLGHSLGGVIMYVQLAKTRDTRVASLCAIASPLEFLVPWAGCITWLASWMTRRFGRASLVPTGRAVAPFAMPLPLDFILLKLSNVPTRVLRPMAVGAFSAVPHGLVDQYRLWIGRAEIVGADGTADYKTLLPDLERPICRSLAAQTP